jgi:Shedu protein SduA, C-terminal
MRYSRCDRAMDVLKPKIGGGGGKLREEFEIHVTDWMKIVAVYWVTDSSDPDRKHVNLRIEQYKKKKPSDPGFPQEPTQKINLQDDDIANLISSARAQSILKDSDVSDRVIVMKGHAAGEVLKLTNRDIASITQLVGLLSDENIQALAKHVNPEVVEKIDSAVKYIRMGKSLNWLRAKIEEDVDEAVFQKWFDENTWIFGKNYVDRVEKRTIGLQSRADLIYISVDGFADLVELKKSVLNRPMLLPDASHKTFYPSQELSRALAQAMHYLQVIEDHRLQLVELVKIPVLRPTITIVIGRSHDWDDGMKEQLRILNSTLLNIKVLTYDHLLAMGDNIVQLYEPKDGIPF